GDRLTLKIKVPSGGGAFLPDAVEKTYVLAGVLGDQSIHRERFMWRAERGGEYYAKNLSAVVSRQERIEAGGRPAVRRLVALAPGVSPEAFLDYAFESLPFSGADLRPYSVFAGSDAPLMLAIIAVLGVVLVLAACMGIVAAFSATLSERRAQIGMLRAVGATRRQIRGLFGREAAFIALTTAPAAVAAAHGAAWALARALGGALTYQVAAWALPAELAFSLLCVAGAAAIPLLGASRVSPMQAIRETSLLRAKKRMRIKPRAAFWPPRLLAGRHLRMYRARQSGVAALVALSMVLLSLGVWMLLVTGIYLQDYDYDFEMYSYATERDAFVELDAFQPAFTDGDLREAAALPLVSDVQVDRRVRVNLMLDRVSEYVVGADWSAAYDYLKDDPTDGLRLRYLDLRKWLGTDKQLVSAPLIACSEAAIERLKSYVLAGEIDVEALNAGREVLIVAPDEIYTYTRRDEAGDEIEFGVGYRPDQLRRYDTVLTNDLFFAGGTLDLCRLYSEGAQRLVADADDYNYAAIRRVDRTVTIGAVLDGDATLPAGTLYWGELPLVTTLPGLSALGMETGGYRNMSVALGEQPDEATEEYLETRLTDMANRLDNAGFSSSIRAARDNRRTRDMLAACFAAVLTLFFALCVGMVNNAVTNRIRADRRSIGTLRAVGAPLQAIAQSYRLQVAMMLAWGAAAGAALSAGAFLWIDWYGGPMPVG
ncbi:MAG: ABC transporter permease, partial [Clostridiales bacterium]|nr:ABC transporter permease [Clostridiales bacterium]